MDDFHLLSHISPEKLAIIQVNNPIIEIMLKGVSKRCLLIWLWEGSDVCLVEAALPPPLSLSAEILANFNEIIISWENFSNFQTLP